MNRDLSAHDKECVQKLKDARLFTNVDPKKLEGIEKGVIIALCSDGHQFQDTYSHIATMCNKVININCIHPVALNGGALLMSGNMMPEEQRSYGNCMFEHIVKASEIKGISHVFLYTHFPCAIATAHDLCAIDQGLHLMASKRRLMEANPNFRISCFFHVSETETDSEPKRRTYFLPKEAWSNPETYRPVLHYLAGKYKEECSHR